MLNALSEVFPDTSQMICLWHIQKNILAEVKPYLAVEALKVQE